MKALSTAISSGALGSCTLIDLRSNNIGAVGMQAFSEAIRSGSLTDGRRNKEGLLCPAGLKALQVGHVRLEAADHHPEQRMGCPMDAAGDWMRGCAGRGQQQYLMRPQRGTGVA